MALHTCCDKYNENCNLNATFVVSKSYAYRGRGIYDVKGSVCFVFKFALLPLSPSRLWSANFKTKQARDLINTSTCMLMHSIA